MHVHSNQHTRADNKAVSWYMISEGTQHPFRLLRPLSLFIQIPKRSGNAKLAGVKQREVSLLRPSPRFPYGAVANELETPALPSARYCRTLKNKNTRAILAQLHLAR